MALSFPLEVIRCGVLENAARKMFPALLETIVYMHSLLRVSRIRTTLHRFPGHPSSSPVCIAAPNWVFLSSISFPRWTNYYFSKFCV